MSNENLASSTGDLDSTVVYSIDSLFKFIKPFDGDRERLTPYLNSVDSAFSLAKPNQHNILLAFAKTQLIGKAEAACSNHIFDSWDSLKDYLKNIYSDKKHHGHLLMELQNCKQGLNETISQYICRIETAVKRLLTSVQQNCSDSLELPGRLVSIEDLALHTFIINVKPQISQMLRARNIKTLNEAHNIALEEEKTQLLIHKQPISSNNSKYCSYCKKVGHTTINCFKKPSTSSNLNSYPNPNRKIYSASTSQNSSSRFNQNNSNSNYVQKQCAYCKRMGHLISECRKRQFNENQKNLNKNPSSSSQSDNKKVFVGRFNKNQNKSTTSKNEEGLEITNAALPRDNHNIQDNLAAFVK